MQVLDGQGQGKSQFLYSIATCILEKLPVNYQAYRMLALLEILAQLFKRYCGLVAEQAIYQKGKKAVIQRQSRDLLNMGGLIEDDADTFAVEPFYQLCIIQSTAKAPYIKYHCVATAAKRLLGKATRL